MLRSSCHTNAWFRSIKQLGHACAAREARGRSCSAFFSRLLILAAAFAFSAPGQTLAAEQRAPEWAQLSANEKAVLAALEEDWPNIEGARRQKWVEIARRYPSMSKAQQDRLQSRMRHWAALSAAERTQVRERYRMLKQMPPKEREEILRRWQEYDSLTDEEKDVLRQAHPKPAKP